MSINITELDASLTLRNLNKEEKKAVVRLMELSIEETKAYMQARIKEADDLLYAFSFAAETLVHKGCDIEDCEYKQAAAYIKKYKVVPE